MHDCSNAQKIGKRKEREFGFCLLLLSVGLEKGLTREGLRVARDGDRRLFYVGTVKKYTETCWEVPAGETVLGRVRERQGGPRGTRCNGETASTKLGVGDQRLFQHSPLRQPNGESVPRLSHLYGDTNEQSALRH